jgi:hypothetical protein
MTLRVLTLSLSILSVSAAGLFAVNTAFADETVKEKAEEAANDTKRGIKKGARAVEDKACEMVNGKMECAAKKIKHSMQNGADKVEDAVD